MSRSSVPAQDYTEVVNLYAYYNHCSDEGDADGYASCFAASGELVIPAIDLHITGRPALLEFKRQDAARRGERIRRHWNSGINLEPWPDGQLRGQCYLHGYNGLPGEAPVLADIGRYEDWLVRENGEWCFLKRIILMDHSSFTRPA